MADNPIDPYELSRDLVEQNKRAKAKRERKQARDDGNGDAALHGEVLPPELHGCPLTEDGVAQAFAIERGNQLRFCHGPNRWHRWDGTCWRLEQTRLAFSWVRDLARRMARSADTEALRAALGKAAFAGGVERFAQSDRAFAVAPDVWDQDRWLLGTPGGTVDLRTGELRRGRQEDWITKTTSVTPTVELECPLWDQFLDHLTDNDTEVREFLRRLAGYFLTGLTIEEILVFLYGLSGTGKTTFLETLCEIMGDYARAMPIEAFTGEAHLPVEYYRAQIVGIRLVIANEPDVGAKWSEGLIKGLTGGDRVTGRHPSGRPFDFKPTHKLLISGNHAPRLRGRSDAMERRLRFVPCDHKPEAPNKKLKQDLVAERPAILRWAIEGALAWQSHGLSSPARVSAAGREYFERQDRFGRWLTECCILDAVLALRPSAVLAAFNSWLRGNNEPQINRNDLAELLRNHPKLQRKTIHGVDYICGLGLQVAQQDC